MIFGSACRHRALSSCGAILLSILGCPLVARAVINADSLQKLSDPKLTLTDRRTLTQQINDAPAALNQITDPQLLLNAASATVKSFVDPDVNILEYFGEENSDATKARLQPMVNSAVDLYQRAVEILDAQQSALADKIKQPGDDAATEWQKVNQNLQTASYTRWMLAYAQALSMDRADKRRAAVADEAIAKLSEWDNVESGVRPLVRLQLGKLNMLKGKPADLKEAQKILQSVADMKPDRFTQFNAEYFVAVCDVLKPDADLAEKHAGVAADFSKKNLADILGDDYAMSILRYRIALIHQDTAGAIKILQDLAQQAPGLRPIISEQVLNKLPPDPVVTKLPPIMLSALVDRGWTAAAAPSPDRATLELALAAANEYLARSDKADPQTTPQGGIDASKSRGVILRTLGRHVEAARALIDHAQRYLHDPQAQALEAINAAIAEIALLDRDNPADGTHQEDISGLEDRLLPLAVDSFNRYDLAYEYARRLQRANHPAQAADKFDLVPKDDPNAFNALYFKLVALNQRLDSDPRDLINAVNPADLPGFLTQLQNLADQVIAGAIERQSKSSDAKTKSQFQTMRVRAALLAAQTAQERAHDPRRALKLLEGFEAAAASLADEKELLADALNLRVAAYVAAGETSAATDTLVTYLNTVGGDEGLQTVYNLLTQLNRALDRAQTAQDAAQVKELADERAQLTPFLVKWAQDNAKPDIKKLTYRYRVFDAATQRQAAELEPEGDARTSKLKAALDKYQQLTSDENVKLYQASLSPDAGPDIRDYPDPAITLGIADTAFDLGDWKLAHDSIGRLLADSKLGDPTLVIKTPAGQNQTIDNDQFWQAQYEFIFATDQLSHDPSSGVQAETARVILGRLQTVWQDKLGGDKWHAKFVELARTLNVGQ